MEPVISNNHLKMELEISNNNKIQVAVSALLPLLKMTLTKMDNRMLNCSRKLHLQEDLAAAVQKAKALKVVLKMDQLVDRVVKMDRPEDKEDPRMDQLEDKVDHRTDQLEDKVALKTVQMVDQALKMEIALVEETKAPKVAHNKNKILLLKSSGDSNHQDHPVLQEVKVAEVLRTAHPQAPAGAKVAKVAREVRTDKTVNAHVEDLMAKDLTDKDLKIKRMIKPKLDKASNTIYDCYKYVI